MPETGIPHDETSKTVGRLIADALRQAGVRTAYTVPGESFLGLLDMLDDAGIRVVAARHEGGAAFMAAAHGHLTGKPSALLVTRAVGAANAAIGIHTALSDSVPMFVLVGQVQLGLSGREAFQEVDQVATFGRLCKWAREPRSPAEAKAALEQAAHVSTSGRPGPVLIALPEDLLDQSAPPSTQLESPHVAAADDEASLDRDGVRAIVELLANADRPVIIAGAGVLRARASAELTQLAEALEVPVIASWRRPDVIDNLHPLYQGMTGYWAAPTVLPRLADADAILVVGSRLSDPTTFGYKIPAADVAWAHVDLEPRTSHAGLTSPTLSLGTDAGQFLRTALELAAQPGLLDRRRLAARRQLNEIGHEQWLSASVVDTATWQGPGVHPGRVIATLNRALRDDAIITSDAGNFAGWAARGFRFRRPGTFLGPTSGAMGYAVPAAIAAAIAQPQRQVVAMAGDGGMAMTMAELETAVRERARFVALCFDNQRFGTIRMWQERRQTGVGVATELGPINFGAVARGLGARGITVDEDETFEPALRSALAEDGPTLIHLVVDRRWVSVDSDPAAT